jgi:hypothetical protein
LTSQWGHRFNNKKGFIPQGQEALLMLGSYLLSSSTDNALDNTRKKLFGTSTRMIKPENLFERPPKKGIARILSKHEC